MLVPKKQIVKRYEHNPIITADDMPFDCAGVYNSGATRFKDQYLMMLRVESIDITDYFWVATSDDGYKFKVWDEPVPMPDDAEFQEYAGGMIYDPRVVELEGTYYLTFACHSGHGVRIGLMSTKDFKQYQWLGCISETDNRNCALFPERVKGSYLRLDRPITPGDHGDIWISYSPDLIHWGRSKCIAKTGGGWSWKKIGAGAPPIKTKQGWLEIFHGVHVMASGYVYHIGVMLLDLDDPSKVIARGKAPILSPKLHYERVGLTMNVVFTSGAIPEPDGTVKIYYGGADTVQCIATAKLDDLIDACYNR
ncbi:MAG: glycoside hydrolase family 130 protein [bacterium]